MNERFKQLIKAAGGIGHDEDGQELTPMLVGSSLEKFAELIVRECAEIVKDSPWKLGNSYAASDQAWLIKEHFGVEE
jgi:hypothetical protein